MSDAHGDLTAFIVGVRRRWLACVRLRALGLASLASSVPIAVALLLDRTLHPEGRPLVALATLAACAVAITATRALWRVRRPPDDRRVARFIEERAALNPAIGSLEDAVVTAVSVPPDGTLSFSPLLAAAANRRLAGLTPAVMVPTSALRRAAGVAAAGVLVFVGITWPAVPPLVAAAETAWLAWSPESIRIDVLPGHVRVPVGSPVNIRAVVRVGSRVATRFQASAIVYDGGEVRTLRMAGQVGAFELPVTSVDRTFRYRVAAGRRTSPEFTVTALVPPEVRRVDARYEYPSFTGLPPRTVEDTGDLHAPVGTRVRLRVHTDRPVTAGSMTLSSGATETALRKTGETLLEGDLLLARDDAYRLRLADADGLRGGGETEYFIRVVDDRPPEVRIVRPGGDQPITPLQELTIEARADDDHGVAALALSYSVAGQPERTVPFSRLSGTSVARVGAYLLSGEELRVQPGDVITYYARARDIGRGKRPTETRTDMFFLEVGPFDGEFVSADSQAGAGSGDPQIDGLIAAQKDIISATWRIERRSGTGRSAEDLKSVAQAQRELQGRAQQMSRGSRPTSAFQLPQQVGQSGQRRMRTTGAEAVASAVQAMGHAVDQLDREKTKEALPYEMEALRGLLQAQAEVRRRQVAQQARGASGNGYGRQGQDLSALFDKELQRQQRTNYETRPSTSERRDAGRENAALDRIRDLARRQEDLNGRQREVAQAPVSSEERKRRLEELAREQEDLRERADRVARQLDVARGSSGAGSPEMREAAAQMRSAATELQRQDPSAAAMRSMRAAEQLRAIEERMRRGLASPGEHAAADLRLEGQQIVEEQRRIAEQAARLDTDDAAESSVRRRLSAEKTSLADRVDALERAARRTKAQGRSRGDAATRAAGEGAEELQRQRVGERMRSSASDIQNRRGTGRERAESERQIARALESAVARFGTGLPPDARTLSQQLDESRAIRERLDGLAGRLRELEGRAQAGRRGAGAPGEAAGGRTDPRPGRSGGTGAPMPGADQGDARAELRREYAQELARARAELDRLTRAQPRGAEGGATPEEQVFSRSSPGNEAFKQDFSNWESLRKGIDVGLEEYEAALSRRLARQLAADRLSAGGSDRGPDAYAGPIARYYESLARTKR